MPQTVGNPLRKGQRPFEPLRQLPRRERVRPEGREQGPEVARPPQGHRRDDLSEPTIDDGVARPASSRTPDLVDLDGQHLHGQVRVGEDPGQPDEIIEDVDQGARLGLSRGADSTPLARTLDDPTGQDDRLDDPDLILGEESAELGPQWSERPRLNLDQGPFGRDRIDPKSVDGNFGAASQGGTVPLLELSVQARLHDRMRLLRA